MSSKITIGDATFWLGDCLDVMVEMVEMADKNIDVVITDPPYGINMDKGFKRFGGFGKPIARKRYEDGNWDRERPDGAVFSKILSLSKVALIFGGNYFADMLPMGTHWIVWDKKNTMPTFSDCELIWTNSKRKSVKIKQFEYNGLIGKERERFHPTQKPIGLMTWLVEKYSKELDIVFDPFMGSGTTALACYNASRKFIGIEKEKKYFDIAVARYRRETAQLRIGDIKT